MRRSSMILAGLASLLMLAAPGCVTKRRFAENAQSTDTRFSSVEAAVEANERRIMDLRKETDSRIGEVDGRAIQAMSKAEAAEKAARGKIIWSLTLSDDKTKFPHDVAAVSPDAGQALDQLASTVKDYGKAVYLEIEGHTDSNGSDAYNMILGENRAKAVRTYLNQHGGLPLHAMNTISFGESQPVADNSTNEGRSQNRRVTIKVLE